MNRSFLSKGERKKSDVVVPNNGREQLKTQSEKQRLIDSLTRALKEVKLMEDGKLPEPDINDLFKD